MWKVLVSDKIHDEGVKLLAENKNITLLNRPDIQRDELLDTIGEVDGIVTRSGTTLDAEVLSRADNLKVVARAGVGVDNIDLMEASRRGVIVINAPDGNTLSAADFTMGMILSLVRKIPNALNSLRSGEWKRSSFAGHQLKGKKLLIVGLGRIGYEVAQRARSFGMEILVYDPFVLPERAAQLSLKLASGLEEALAVADIVTIHVPMTSETRGMISGKELKACKNSCFLINCARGGLVDEADCAEAIREGQIAGAAFDVYGSEPPEKGINPLLADDISEKVILTPHLGANTYEAQSSVARIAVENLLGALESKPYYHTVNLPFLEHMLEKEEKEYLSLAGKMAFLAGQILDEPAKQLKVTMRGPVFGSQSRSVCFELPYKYSPFTIASLKGLLEVYHGRGLSYMSAPLLAMERGLLIEESNSESRNYKNMLEIVVEGQNENVEFRATVTEEGKQRIISVNGFMVDLVPQSVMLMFQNHDRPGVIGKIGSVLGSSGVNIANFTLGRKNGSGLALGVLEIDDEVPPEAMKQLADDADLLWLKMVDLREEL